MHYCLGCCSPPDLARVEVWDRTVFVIEGLRLAVAVSCRILAEVPDARRSNMLRAHSRHPLFDWELARMTGRHSRARGS